MYLQGGQGHLDLGEALVPELAKRLRGKASLLADHVHGFDERGSRQVRLRDLQREPTPKELRGGVAIFEEPGRLQRQVPRFCTYKASL